MRLAILSAAAVLAVAGPSWGAPVQVGQPAPDFHVTTFDGRYLSLADFKGQVLIINIWATWCAPCRQELPLLNGYYLARRPKGLTVLAVPTDDSGSDTVLRPVAHVLAFPMAEAMHGPYRVKHEAVPTNYVIDRNGVVRYAQAGAFDDSALMSIVDPLLDESAAPSPAAEAGDRRVAVNGGP